MFTLKNYYYSPPPLTYKLKLSLSDMQEYYCATERIRWCSKCRTLSFIVEIVFQALFLLEVLLAIHLLVDEEK